MRPTPAAGSRRPWARPARLPSWTDSRYGRPPVRARSLLPAGTTSEPIVQPGRIHMSENPDAIVTDAKTEGAGGCPVAHGRAPHPTQGGGNRQWWPDQLNLRILAKNPAVANPLGETFDYAAAFNSLELDEVKRDIEDVLTTSQDWWPADYGHY